MENRKYQIQSWRQNRVALPKDAQITGVSEHDDTQGLYWLHVIVDPTAKNTIRIINVFNTPETGPSFVAALNGLYFWDLGEIPYSPIIPEVTAVYELDVDNS